MPVQIENHTVFIGSEDTILNIYDAINDATGEFDFDHFYPDPKRITNMGAPRMGKNTHVHQAYRNLLMASYETTWRVPRELFNELKFNTPNLHIINGWTSKGFADTVHVSHGKEEAFNTYFTVTIKPRVTVKPANNSDQDLVLIDYATNAAANNEVIATLLEHNMLVDKNGCPIDLDQLN